MRGPAVHPIVIAAGGTGGHFFPAEALAAALLARGERVALLTDQRAAEKLPPVFARGEVYVLRGAGIAGRGLRRGAAAMGALAAGTMQARAILRSLRPSVIVGFGGYPTIAPVLATRLLRDPPPVVLHEQNAVLGRANRAMAGRASLLALSFATTQRIPRGVPTLLTGNPVRAGFGDRAAHPTLPAGLNLLVLGGSLGARVFSDAVPATLGLLPEATRRRLRVVQQCRPEDIERVTNAYRTHAITAELSTFFPDVAARLAAADLVIARAGASTVAELAVAGRPAILVPLPGAIDDHQTANAEALALAGGAWVIAQRDIATLGDRLASLLADPYSLVAAGRAAASLARPDAADRLADAVMLHARVMS